MDINAYVDEIEYAASTLIEVIWAEHAKLAEMEKRLATLTAETRSGYDRAHAISANAEDADDVMMGAGVHWETYFGADKERHGTSLEVGNLVQLVDLHQFSVASLSGSLLQHAKQGISIAHRGLHGCPDGRIVAAPESQGSDLAGAKPGDPLGGRESQRARSHLLRRSPRQHRPAIRSIPSPEPCVRDRPALGLDGVRQVQGRSPVTLVATAAENILGEMQPWHEPRPQLPACDEVGDSRAVHRALTCTTVSVAR